MLSESNTTTTMPRNAIFGQITKPIYSARVGPIISGIDNATLLSRLLFFDEVIIRSVRLQEVPFLVKMFGLDGFEQLLSLGILKISSEMSSIVTDVHRDGKREVPLLHFTQGLVDIADREKYLTDCMTCLLQISGLSNAKRQLLAETIISKMARPTSTYGPDLLAQVRKDLKSNTYLIKAALMRDNADLSLEQKMLELKLEEISEGVQRIETNLQSLLGISEEREHTILASTVTAVVNLNTRMADMEAYSAISLFDPSEAPLLFGKIHGIISPHNPIFEEKAFLRVLEFTDIPQMITSGRIDVPKLLKIRDSNECREFRSWLTTTDRMNDQELKRLVAGFRARAASYIGSTSGKVLRLATNAGLGLIPGYGTLISLTEGAVDAFLIDKLLPSSGVLSFLNSSVPSLFSRAYD